MAVAGRIDLSPLATFDPVSDPSSLSQRWKSWKRRFEIYIAALNVSDDKQKKAILLYQAGQATQEIFDTIPETGDDFATAMEKLDTYFIPQKNVSYEIFQFRKAVQLSGETVDQFATRLRKLASTCEFTDLGKELKSTIIQNCQSKHLRRVALRDDLSLVALLAKARAQEASEEQAKGIEQTHSAAEAVNVIQQQRQPRKWQPPRTWKKPEGQSTCRKCGYLWPHKNSSCPAQGQTCNKCGKSNHFAKVCISKQEKTQGRYKAHESQPKHKHKLKSQICQVSSESYQKSNSSGDEYLYTLGDTACKAAPKVNVKINNITVSMIVDTGASTDVMDEKTFAKVNQANNLELQPSAKNIFAYGADSQLTVVGQFDTDIEVDTKSVRSTIHVVRGSHGSLLSYKTACDLGLVHIKIKQMSDSPRVSEMLVQKYPNLFEGIGKLKNTEIKLHIDTNVPPVAQATRRIPFHMRKQVEKELINLEEQGIIEEVEGSTPWVSPLVIIPKKNGEVRLCVDMRRANKAINRERHPSPTIDDLIHNLNGATVFTKLDLRQGYHQIPLSPESRYITTFTTHKGLRRYARLNFGTNSASEMFQNIICEQIRDIPGSINFSDDVIIFGKTQADHDKALQEVFERFSSVGLSLNKTKCEFSKNSLTFFGFVFSDKGISPDPKKVQAIHDANPPTSTSGVRSFLGMATYCAKFIPCFSDISQPLRELTRKDVHFVWTKEHDKAFHKIKQLLASDTIMAYFDQEKETELITDASPVGLSAILFQKSQGDNHRKVVAYASRSLSDVESRYSQTEKEALAIVWAIEKFHLYLYGGHFTLYTDCKPVQLIYGNPKSKPPARIERWNLRLQGYDFSIVHTKGDQNPSDFLSRHPNSKEPKKQEVMAEDYVNFISAHAVPKAMTLSEIREATTADPTLQQLSKMIRTNEWIEQTVPEADIAEIKHFKKVKQELTVNSDESVILRGNRIVVPTSLRKRAIMLAHEGHQGIVKTKKLLREKIWFPGIESSVKQQIDNCIACQANGPQNRPEPLQMSTLPPEPWHTVHVDFCGPFPTGEYLLVTIDAYSRFPEAEIIQSTAAKGTISKLDRIFATHGIPRVLKTDNGPPFFGHEFKTYMEENGISHQKITPLWPQANSEAENFMKPLTKAIRSSHAEGRDWKKDLYRFMLNYRATPHCTTGVSPSELLFNRKIKTKLPQVEMDVDMPEKDVEIKQKDKQAKERMKEHADRRARAKVSSLKIGETVLLRQRKKNKFSTKFDPSPFEIVRKKGTMITAIRNGKYITRNISQFKKISSSIMGPDLSEDEYESEMLEDDDNETPPQENSQQNILPVNQVPLTRNRRYPTRMKQPFHRFGHNVYEQ